MHFRRTSLLALALVAAVPATASAQRHQPSFWGSPRIDPWIDATFAHRARFGETLRHFRANGPFEREGTMPIVVRFDAPAVTQRDLARLEAQGVRWERGGRPLASGAYLARATEAGVRALAADPMVGRVQCDLVVDAPAPLDLSAREAAIDTARRAILARDGTALDGRGVVIGDTDSPLFIFHPALFHADAGVHAWVDVNNDGTLTPGTDGVDLDGDGTVAPTEVLHRLAALTFDRLNRPLGMRFADFRADRDWLFLDSNGNGQRDYGAGFEETTPAYGEPLFVVDDADRNNRVAVSEHLLRLGTSKVRMVLADQTYQRGGENGVPLIGYNLSETMMRGGLQDSGHATGVAGILVGGVPNVSAFLGLAPAADLTLADNRNYDRMLGTIGGLQWHLDQGANVLLTEYAPYAGVTLDGSSEEELLIDSALDRGVVTVSPAGNLAEGHKHRTLSLASAPVTVTGRTDGLFAGARLVQFSIHWRAASRNVSVAITLPGRAPFMVPDVAPRGFDMGNGVQGYSLDELSMRGTRTRHIVLATRATMPAGQYEFVLTPTAGAAFTADVYTGDDRSTWGGGMTFPENDTARTICHPSTSDQAISVGAYVLHGETGFNPSASVGDLAGYSSRGPRIDNDTGIDIVAPDNPMSLTQPDPTHNVPYGALAPFGGTSGAGPHVAAAAALLRQLYPEETGAALRARLLDHTRTDRFVRADQPTLWGRGKLDTAAAAGLTAAAGRAPALVLRAAARVRTGRDAIITPEVVDDEPRDALRVRWDLDYDGTYDTDWVGLADQVIRALPRGVRDVRAEVRDGQGYLAGATVRIEGVDNLPDAPDAGGDGGADGGGGGGGEGCRCATAVGAPGRATPLAWWAAAAAAVVLRTRWRRRR